MIYTKNPQNISIFFSDNLQRGFVRVNSLRLDCYIPSRTGKPYSFFVKHKFNLPYDSSHWKQHSDYDEIEKNWVYKLTNLALKLLKENV